MTISSRRRSAAAARRRLEAERGEIRLGVTLNERAFASAMLEKALADLINEWIASEGDRRSERI
jgi:hypothetical protein